MKHIATLLSALKQQKSEKRAPKRPRNEYEFLPAHLEVIEKPPAPRARITALVLTSFLIIVVLWSVFGQLDIHAGAHGRIMVSSHSKVIQPLEQGEVFRIHVKDGQYVERGEVLIELNTVDIQAEIARLSEQILQLELDSARLRALLSVEPEINFVPPALASELRVKRTKSLLISEIKETQTLLDQLIAEQQVNKAQQQANKHDLEALANLRLNIEERLEARRILAKSQSIARVELLEQEKELLDVVRTISGLTAQKSVLKAQYLSIAERKDSLLAQKRREYFEELTQAEVNLSQVKQELIKSEEQLRRKTLRSPVDGIVQQLSIHTLGGVVEPAQALMVVVPAKAKLEAEVKVLNKDIGFVLAGQSVEIKIDSFPFTKYGTIKGEVLYISQDAVQDEQLGLVFPARVKLSRSNIVVDDYLVNLSAGMSVMAEIQTGKRRVIEYLLSPLQQYQSEALRER
jgi:RTX toxin transport system membrane fusion protein